MTWPKKLRAKMSKQGVLLLNIGSPHSPAVNDVKKYLKTFLMDENVIDVPLILRWLLVNGIIVPRRAAFSAENYKKIWLEGEGSPLIVFTDHFAKKLQHELDENYAVKIGMRYSEPSIHQALDEFHKAGINNIILAPLYPQYADATTGSSIKEVKKLISNSKFEFTVKSLAPFFEQEAFTSSYCAVIKDSLKNRDPDFFLFSFHGLPERHLKKNGFCQLDDNCCLLEAACHNNCYRAQCYKTAAKIADKLALKKDQWTVSFQSQLGRGKWLQPSTINTLDLLARNKIKHLAVVCPSFVTDCLETLEEIAVGGKEIFLNNGGKEFTTVACLNDHSQWVKGFAELLRNQK